MKENKFLEKLTMISGKIGGNIYLQGISRGVMSVLPIIIIGSFASLFSGLPIDAWQNFIQSSGIASALSIFVNATTNFLGIFFTYGIAKELSGLKGLKSKIVPVLAMVVYLTLLPAAALEDHTAVLSYDYLGTKGMIVGIFIAIAIVKLYKCLIDRNIMIHLPESTPDYVKNSFASLIPTIIVAIIAIALRIACSYLPNGNVFDFIYSTLQIPLTMLVGGSLVANAFLAMLTQASWSLGVHPGYIQSVTAPILFALDGANQASFAASGSAVNIIGMAFNYICTTAVLYPAVAVSVLLFSKSKQMKTLGKVAVAPAFFGVSEPLIFGLPIVFNPVILLPWLLAPVMNIVIGYALTSIGLVAKCAGVTVFNIPMIFTGIMNGNISIAIMEAGLFVLDILLFLPFIKAIDKKYVKDENEEIK